MIFTKVHTKNNVTTNLIEYCNKLYENLDKALNLQLQVSYGKSIMHVNPFDIRRILLETNYDNNTQKLIKLIFANIINANNKSSILNYVSILSTLFFLEKMLKNKNFEKEFDINNFLQTLSHKAKKTNKYHLDKCVNNLISNNLARNILNECYSLIDISGNVFVDKSVTPSTAIELTSGYSFKIFPVPEFITMSRLKSFKSYNPKIVLIDGMIELTFFIL